MSNKLQQSKKNKVLGTAFAAVLIGTFIGLSFPPQVLHAEVPIPGGPLGSGGEGGGLPGLFVPVNQCVIPGLCPVGTAALVTAFATGKLQAKSFADSVATFAIKSAVNVVRDMVLRWIITGRFEAPVFSQSFSLDAAHAAENASRIFLSGLTNINFCSFVGPPPISNFVLSADFSLSCTLPAQDQTGYADYLIDKLYNPQKFAQEHSLAETLKASDAQNNKIYTYAEISRLRDEQITRALISQQAEYLAGGGLRGIRDTVTGLTTIPPSTVASIVNTIGVQSPVAQADIAQTVQQAVTAITQTALRTLVDKGLGAAFGR